uniref:Uncharacterized protein n=1 Tax=Nelumbo nucifera TaxID=4432 RepID=A0A822YZJ6_NELNU|nr:TPA_asm: hypothetical protein HUJ06_008581 [Nelumbo nucifera]
MKMKMKEGEQDEEGEREEEGGREREKKRGEERDRGRDLVKGGRWRGSMPICRRCIENWKRR